MSSVSVNLFEPVVERIDVLDSGMAVVRLGEHPASVAVFVKGGIPGVAEWIASLADKISEILDDNIVQALSSN